MIIENNLTELLNLPDSSVVSWKSIAESICLHIQLNNSGIHCPHCQSIITELNQNRPILIRDLSVFGRAVYLRVPRRQFYCRLCQRYSTEHLEWLDWKRRHTQRYEENIFERIKGTSIERVAQEEKLSFDEIECIFKHLSQSKVKKKWSVVKRISIDEIAMRKGQQSFKTVVSDLERGKLIEVIDGLPSRINRSKAYGATVGA